MEGTLQESLYTSTSTQEVVVALEQLAEIHNLDGRPTPVFRVTNFFQRFADYLVPNFNYAVLDYVRVIGDDGSVKGYITVKDTNFVGDDAKHKFASGRRNPKRDEGGISDKSVHDTAAHELHEESGVSAADGPESFRVLYGRVVRNPRHLGEGWHAKFLCMGDVPESEVPHIYNPAVNPHVPCPVGNEGEIGFFHTPSEFRDLFAWGDFFFVHKGFLDSAKPLLQALDRWPLS